MNLAKHFRALSLVATVLLCLAAVMRGGTATGINGLFYTGVDNSGNVLAGGAQDSHWSVSYANVNGTGSTSSSYTGGAYVLSSTYIDAGYVQNTSTSKWITAPGASTAASGGTTNIGGDYLPGNGTTGTNTAYYVYKLAFTISGSGTTVNNQVSISLTIAADDQYSVYVNPTSAPTVNASTGAISTGSTAASGSATNAWGNTSSLTLANYGTGNNANFVIGTNYLYIVVANTNSQTGNNNSNALNPSGLLVYQVGSANLIDGNPVPEVGAWLPVIAALGVFGLRRLRQLKEAVV